MIHRYFYRKYKFEWLNYKRLAEILIKEWEYWRKKLVENIDKFKWIDYNKIAEELIQVWEPWLIINYFEKFQWLDNEIIKKCIKTKFKYDDKYETFEEFLKRYNWKLDYCIAENLVKYWMYQLVRDYSEKFNELDYKNFIELLIKNGNRKFLFQYIKEFRWELDYEIAINLIDNELSEIVAKNLNKFKWLNKKIAEKLVEDCYPKIVFTNLDKFELLDNDCKETINKSLDLNMRQDVNNSLIYIEKRLDETIVSKLIIEGERSSRASNRWTLQSVIEAKKIKINHPKILKILIESDYHSIDNYIKEFKCWDKDMAKMLIEENCAENVVRNLKLFKDLDKEIAEKLTEAWYWDIVEKNPEKFWLKK